MTTALYIPPKVYDELIKVCVDAQPNEAYGLLIGEATHSLSSFVELGHIAPDSTEDFKFSQINLDEYLPTLQAEGLSILGLFHARPADAPLPSPQIVQDLASRNALLLVISLKGVKPALNAWQIGDAVDYVPIVFDPDEADLEAEFRLSSWTQKQNVVIMIITTLSIIALIILSIILLPPAP